MDVLTVDKLPPTTVMSELLNLVVAVLIVNVTVDVCPGVNDVRVEEIVQVTAVTRVSIVKLIGVEENVVDPFVPDIDITPDVVEFVVGVNVAV